MNKDIIPVQKYIVKAFYDWISDNGYIVHIRFDMTYPNVSVPEGIANDNGNVILNISADVVTELDFNNDSIFFVCTFSGVEFPINVPYYCLSYIYSADGNIGKEFAIHSKKDIEAFFKAVKDDNEINNKNDEPKDSGDNIISFNINK